MFCGGVVGGEIKIVVVVVVVVVVVSGAVLSMIGSCLITSDLSSVSCITIVSVDGLVNKETAATTKTIENATRATGFNRL